MSELPNCATPLLLADGRVVLPSGMVIPAVAKTPVSVAPSVAPPDVEEPAPEPQLPQLIERPLPSLASVPMRKIGDLPDVPRVINAINVVIGYSLFGMPDIDICTATGMRQEQLDKLRSGDTYDSMRNTIVRSVLDAEAQSIRDLFLQNARAATGVLVDSMSNGSRGDRIAAARDLLDRAGHRPADVVEHRHRVEGGLVIEIVRKDERDNTPIIDMEVL